jgi:hypothetical protein
MAKDNEGGFGWTDKVDVPETSYSVLPEGEAFFTITKLKRERKEFGKFGTINVAVMTCTPAEKDGSGEIDVQFGLHAAMGWKILQLATACGLRKAGDGNEVDPRWWAEFEGKTGRCMIEHRQFARKKDKPGEKTGVANDIAEFLAPETEKPDADNLKF